MKIEALTDIDSLQNETSAIQSINTNNERIEEALANTLSLDGSTPNAMAANLDVGGFRIINLAAPVGSSDAVRKIDLDAATGSLDQDLIDAILAAPDAAADAIAARDQALIYRDQASAYIGAAVTADHWTSSRTITLGGSVSGSQSFDGSSNFTVTVSIVDGAVSAAKLASGAAVSNIGYTPANKAGDTLTGDLILTLAPATLSVYSAGFRGIPVATHDANYTFVLGDSATMSRHTSGTAHAWTIPPNSSVNYPLGTAIVGRNFGTGVVTLTRGSGVALRMAGSGTSANVAMAQYGMFTAIQEATDVWVVQGVGLS